DVAVVFGGEAGAGDRGVVEDLGPLRIPDQGVAVDAQAVVAGEGDDPVGGGEVVAEPRAEGALHLLLPFGSQLGAVSQDLFDPVGLVQLRGHAGGAEGRGHDVLQGRGETTGGRPGGGEAVAGGEG